MDKRYLTVAEFAATEGISTQRVYQLLKTRLKPFVQEVGGVKVIDSQALSRKDDATPLQTEPSAFTQEFAQPVAKDDKALDLLKYSLDLLAAQIEEKDRLIDELQRMNAEKDRHIQEQSKEVATLLSQSQELQRNNQVLLAQFKSLEQPVDKPLEQPAQEPQGFWRRLFNK